MATTTMETGCSASALQDPKTFYQLLKGHIEDIENVNLMGMLQNCADPLQQIQRLAAQMPQCGTSQFNLR